MNLAVQNVDSMTKQSSGGSRRMYWERIRVPVSQIINTPVSNDAMFEWTNSQTVRYANGTTKSPIIAHTWCYDVQGERVNAGGRESYRGNYLVYEHCETTIGHYQYRRHCNDRKPSTKSSVCNLHAYAECTIQVKTCINLGACHVQVVFMYHRVIYISKDGLDMYIIYEIHYKKYKNLRADKLWRFLTFTVMVLSRLPIYWV